MADEKIIFSMNGVGKILPHNNRVILKDIYLSFFYGAKIGIVGLNGSGKSNRVTLGDREDLLTTEAVIADVRVRDWEWLQESPELQARIRYKSPAVPAHLSPISNTQSPIANYQSPIANNQSPISNTPTLPEGASVHFVSPVWGITPGQSLVMYKDGLVVGGGIIQ